MRTSPSLDDGDACLDFEGLQKVQLQFQVCAEHRGRPIFPLGLAGTISARFPRGPPILWGRTRRTDLMSWVCVEGMGWLNRNWREAMPWWVPLKHPQKTTAALVTLSLPKSADGSQLLQLGTLEVPGRCWRIVMATLSFFITGEDNITVNSLVISLSLKLKSSSA